MILRHNFTTKLVIFFVLFNTVNASETNEKRVKISELALPGQQIGFAIEPQPENLDRANFYVVFPVAESNVEKLISVNEKTGEIRLQGALDHEREKELVVLVIPTDGSPSQKVIIEVEDSNDNTPTFPVSSIQLEISEQARIDTELPLPLASDPDSHPFNVQKYRIAGGNVNNVFRLSARRLNNQLYADLIVNGNLDREYRNRYDLLIEAIDGGSPPKIGKLEVRCIILDANDNRPEFEHSRYSIQVPSNVTLGQSIITVSADDEDDGENARIIYTLSHANYEEVYYYQIDPSTGQISVAIAPLPAGTTHELLVTATDNGMQPLESSVFLTINILDEDFGQHTEGLQISWLTENSQPILAENLTIGYLVARLEIGPEYANNMKFTLTGCDSLCLKETDSPLVFLLMVCGPLDRELNSYYRLLFTLTDSSNHQLFQHPVHVEVEDLNDNQPEWSQPLYKITFNRSYDDEIEQRTVGKLVAHDRDVGENAHLRYSLHGTNLFQINPETGVLTAIQPLNCSVGSEVKFRVVAEDNGKPRLSSSADVIVLLVDANEQPPFFEKSLYEIVVKEDVEIGECLVKVKAANRGCGIRENSQIQYSLKVGEHDDEEHLTRIFRLDPKSGKLCLGGRLDFERRSRYQLTVLADGQQGKTSSALIDVHVEDVNDHSPQFQPHEYHIKLKENQKYSNSILILYANDEDRGDFGKLHYFIEETSNDGAKFRLEQDSTTGQLYLDRPLVGLKNQSVNEIQLKINARDGGGMTSAVPATVHIYIQSEQEEPCITFNQSPYEFSTTEDILPGIIVGTLRTQPQSPNRKLEILAGDPNQQFRLDSKSGRILITKELDADHQHLYWLTVKATLSGECVNYTQVKVTIHDINDNDPKFDMASVEANILEDYPIHEPFFAVQAIDKDRNENGRVTYELVSSDPPCPIIVRPLSGQLLLAAPLDYEKVKQYRLRIRAQDQGIPPRSSTINLTLNVFDVNDFAPEFTNTLYNAEVSEDASLMSEVLRVSAVDRDEGANSRIRYQISEENSITDFGINPNTGEIFVQRPLDRERQADYRFLVVATDQGTPSLSSNASVIIQIGDINDNSPNCSSIQTLKLNEHQNKHRQLVGILNARDLDAGPNGTVMYRLQKHHEIFDLKSNGELFLRRKIQNMKDSYRFSVIAEDQGPQPRSTVCQVLVRVEGSPSEIVLQEPIERTVQFDSACGTGCPLVRLNATNVKRWSLEEGQKSSKFFDLTDDGLLRLAKKVEDGGDQMFRKPQPLTINLFDAYEQKKQLTLSMKRIVRLMDNSSMVVHLSERSMPGIRITSPIKQLSVKDSNESTVYYALNDESDTFEVDTANGALYLRKRLNYSQNPLYSLKLTKYSLHGIGLNETTIVVDLQNENMNPPRFETPIYKFGVSEGTSIGTVLAQIEAFDEDDGLNGTLNYQIVGENPIFGVEPLTGEITLKQQLQYHLQPKHYFVLEAIDQATNTNERRSSSCVVVAEVIDTNDNSPIFLSPSSMNLLSELLPTNYPVHYFVAKDADSEDFGRVSYKIVNGNQPPMFLVDQQTGALAVLHRPTNSLVQLTVRASDSDPIMPRFTEQLFTIYIQQNEAKWTYFQQPVYDFTLASATINGTLLVDFKRPSFEISAQPKFKLLPQTINDFALDSTSGVLKTNTDLLKYGTYRMTVHVSDVEQKLSDLATVFVHVPEHKSFGPKISTGSCGEVLEKENEPIGRITRVIATINGHESSEIRYQIEGGSGVDLFNINSTTGIISSKSLDRETISEHILVVSASDNSVPRKVDVCTVKIKVLDQNDNSPQFVENEAPEHLEINSEHQVGMVVAKFEATDKDENENGRIIYKLGSDESGIFDIHTESGELFFARELPFLGNSWEIVLLAEDSGLTRVLHAEKRIQVHWKRSTVKMDNFRELEFLRQNQTVVIAEGQPRGKFVLQLETTAKFMPTEKIVYEILEGNVRDSFTIDELGVLKTGQELDAETQQIYHLKLQASMSGNRRSIGYVVVRVLNINDNAPSFPHALSRRIEEDTPIGSLITSVMVRDLDIESTVEYALTAPNDYFELQRSTGDLFLLKSLDYETMPEHLLSIQISIMSDSQWLHSDLSSVWRYYDTALRWSTNARNELQNATDYYYSNNYDEMKISQEDINSVNSTTNLIRQASQEFTENLLYSVEDEDNEEEEEMEIEGHIMGNEEDWTPEMAEFVRKTREHRQELAEARAKAQAVKPKKETEWMENDTDDFVMAEDIGVHGVQKASTSAPTHNKEAEEHKTQLGKLYGSAAEKIEQLEVQINFKFEEAHKNSNAILWPNIPLRF